MRPRPQIQVIHPRHCWRRLIHLHSITRLFSHDNATICPSLFTPIRELTVYAAGLFASGYHSTRPPQQFAVDPSRQFLSGNPQDSGSPQSFAGQSFVTGILFIPD
jgi:hypothetical protein